MIERDYRKAFGDFMLGSYRVYWGFLDYGTRIEVRDGDCVGYCFAKTAALEREWGTGKCGHVFNEGENGLTGSSQFCRDLTCKRKVGAG